MIPALHVQIIQTSWTKNSRGGQMAARRAQIPRAFPVESKVLMRGRMSAEVYNFAETNGFKEWRVAMRSRTLEKLPFRISAFSIDWDGLTAKTHWHWSWHEVGAPEPKVFDVRMGQLEIAPDSWVRLRCQGRFADEDDGAWWYQHTVVNVARCDNNLNVDFAGEPARSFEWLPQIH